jgi:protein TonB
VNASFDEPTIPPRLRRPLAAVWISLGLHAAVIALVQVAPPAASRPGELVIEARLVSTHAAPATQEAPPPVPAPEARESPPQKVPMVASEAEEALPLAKQAPSPPATSMPAAPPQPPAATQSPAPAAAESASQVPAAPVPAAAITSSVDLTYYSARDVDVHPRALREIRPDYPAAADRQQLSGKVMLQLKLEADGRVSDIEVVSANPPGMFEDSARKAFRDARFSPAQKNGQPVRALVLIEVVYDWEGQR